MTTCRQCPHMEIVVGGLFGKCTKSPLDMEESCLIRLTYFKLQELVNISRANSDLAKDTLQKFSQFLDKMNKDLDKGEDWKNA